MSERTIQSPVEVAVADSVGVPPLLERPARGLSIWRRFRRNRLAVGAVVVLVLLALTVIVGPLLIPSARVTAQVRSATFAPPSRAALFGRDEFGRDAFVRGIYGGRTSLWIAFVAAIMNTIIGVLLGVIAG